MIASKPIGDASQNIWPVKKNLQVVGLRCSTKPINTCYVQILVPKEREGSQDIPIVVIV